MKPLVIYHDKCCDGFGAAFAAWKKFGRDAEYLPMNYGQVKADDTSTWPKEYTGRDVYILDFSFPKEVMNELFEAARRVVWLDHHESAFKMWCGQYERGMTYTEVKGDEPKSLIGLDDNRSGAMLAWDFFHPGTEVPQLFRHIDDYDRWQFKLDGTKELNKALWSYTPWSFEQWQEQFLLASDDTVLQASFLHAEGAAILRAHNQNVKSVVRGAERQCKVEHLHYWHEDELPNRTAWSGLAANCPPHLSSDVGHELATDCGTFGLVWYLAKDGKVRCSLRSNGEYNVSEIAKAFGGGGHRNAAGFETDIETLMGWIK